MNPLDMMGPEFLRFYLLWGVGLLAAAWMIREHWRSEASPSVIRWTPGVYPREGDAYTIALLHGDWREVVRTALVRLFSTGLIAFDGSTLRRGTSEAPVSLQPVESAVLAAITAERDGIPAAEVEARAQQAVYLQLRPLEEALLEQGLIPSPQQLRRFALLRLTALFLVLGLGVAKLLVALYRGRSNVGFLVLMLIGYTLATFLVLRPPRRMLAGDQYLHWLRKSHKGLLSLLTSGRRESPGEMALLAGIYGLMVMPAMSPLHSALQPPRRRDDGGSGGFAGGDGGSGGGCGGGSCGGGGCGGCGG